MTPEDVLTYAIEPALTLLPGSMTSRPAKAMLLAIGLQESRFEHRRQQPQGPARGWWQFERAGVRAVFSHRASGDMADAVATRIGYDRASNDSNAIYLAIQHNDVLAAVFARLLLWTVPWVLPTEGQEELAWTQYTQAWRPGRPHRETWGALYRQAWEMTA